MAAPCAGHLRLIAILDRRASGSAFGAGHLRLIAIGGRSTCGSALRAGGLRLVAIGGGCPRGSALLTGSLALVFVGISGRPGVCRFRIVAGLRAGLFPTVRALRPFSPRRRRIVCHVPFATRRKVRDRTARYCAPLLVGALKIVPAVPPQVCVERMIRPTATCRTISQALLFRGVPLGPEKPRGKTALPSSNRQIAVSWVYSVGVSARSQLAPGDTDSADRPPRCR